MFRGRMFLMMRKQPAPETPDRDSSPSSQNCQCNITITRGNPVTLFEFKHILNSLFQHDNVPSSRVDNLRQPDCFVFHRAVRAGAGDVGDGGLLLPIRAYDREAECQVRGQHARQRGGWAGANAAHDPLPRPEL